jgi:protoporphyrinogen/coproporphyrinogen III oxidase
VTARETAGRRAVVVGGGIGGLALAWELQEEAARQGIPLELTVLEAEERAGGSILTERVDGCLVEGGPDSFVTEKPWALALAKDLGLAEHLSPTNEVSRKTYVLWKAKLHALPDGLILLVPTRIAPFVFSRLFSWPGKLRMGLDLILPRRRGSGDETLGDFIRRRFGQEALDKLGEPLVAGIHSGDPETMSVKATFPRFLEMEAEERSLIVAMLKRMRAARQAREAARKGEGIGGRPTLFMTLDEGLNLLVTELTGRLPQGAVRLGEAATAIERVEGGWRVQTTGGEYEADVLAVATPAYVAADLLDDTAPHVAEELRAIPYVSSATVTLAYDRARFPAQPDGFGAVIPKGEQRRIKAFSWVTTKFFGRAPADVVLLRVFIRATRGETEGMSNDDLVAVARSEIADILGVEVDPLWARAYRWDRAMPQYVVGHLDRVDRVEQALEAFPGLVLAGGAYRGSGIPDTVRVSRERAVEIVSRLLAESVSKDGRA